MKIVEKASLEPKDKERLIKAFRILSAFGTTGKNRMIVYPLIASNIENIVDELLDIGITMGVIER